MEVVRISWIVIFFLFALILIFVWSKMLIISNKTKAISELLTKINSLTDKSGISGEKPAETGGTVSKS